MEIEAIKVKVGDLLGEHKGEAFNSGVYSSNGKLYASKYGILTRQLLKRDGKQVTVLSVESQNKANTHNNASLNIGDTLICRVIKIREDGVWVEVLQVNGIRVNSLIEGFIRRELIREKEIDKIKVQECFVPGDVVRTKFVSFGDGRRIYLSTAGEDLGVVYGKCEASGKLMLPFSWTQMVCLKTGLKEERKVARPSQN